MSDSQDQKKDPPDPQTVNAQIVDAVDTSTGYAFGLKNKLQPPVEDGSRLSAGGAIAYDKAAQAAALGVQDATDYARNVLSVSAATQGKAMAMILANKNVPQATEAFVFALIASVVAPIVVAETGYAQTFMLQNFPKG
jgi:hypothetical protein